MVKDMDSFPKKAIIGLSPHCSNLTMDILSYLTESDNHLSNIRRRGEVGGSAKKVGKRIKELERLYGIEHGGNRGNQYEESRNNSETPMNDTRTTRSTNGHVSRHIAEL